MVELLRSSCLVTAWLHADMASSLNLNWQAQEKQSEIRRNSSKGTYLRSSLQCLDNNGLLLLLESFFSRQKKVHSSGFGRSTGAFDVWM